MLRGLLPRKHSLYWLFDMCDRQLLFKGMVMMNKKYYWISWYQPTEDHRPLMFPPNKSVLGWWRTGVRCDDGAKTIVAHVVAENEESAKEVIRKDWPEAEEWRFCDETDSQFPAGSRFPLSDWMKQRYGEHMVSNRITNRVHK